MNRLSHNRTFLWCLLLILQLAFAPKPTGCAAAGTFGTASCCCSLAEESGDAASSADQSCCKSGGCCARADDQNPEPDPERDGDGSGDPKAPAPDGEPTPQDGQPRAPPAGDDHCSCSHAVLLPCVAETNHEEPGRKLLHPSRPDAATSALDAFRIPIAVETPPANAFAAATRRARPCSGRPARQLLYQVFLI